MADERIYVPEAVEAYNRGLDAYLSGDHVGATKFARMALTIDPQMVEATRMVERLSPAVAVKRDPVSMGMYGKGLDAYFAGNTEGAAKYAKSALSVRPDLVEAQRLMERMRGQNAVEPMRKAVKGLRGKRI